MGKKKKRAKRTNHQVFAQMKELRVSDFTGLGMKENEDAFFYGNYNSAINNYMRDFEEQSVVSGTCGGNGTDSTNADELNLAEK